MTLSRSAGFLYRTACRNRYSRSCEPLDHFRTVHHLNENIFEVGFTDLDFFECAACRAALRKNLLDVVIAREAQQMLAAIAVARAALGFERAQFGWQHALRETHEQLHAGEALQQRAGTVQ